MSAADRRDVVILGGGPVGMTLALALARHGISAHVVEREQPATLTAEGADGRASAISSASWNLCLEDGARRKRGEPDLCWCGSVVRGVVGLRACC